MLPKTLERTAGCESDLHNQEDCVPILKGALDMKYKTAATAMVPIADVYMISLDARLDHETMTQVGY